MSIVTPSPSRRKHKASPPPVFIPDELIAEVLSWMTVKSLMRLRCVCKSWNSLISDPTFVKLHLNRSSQNTYITLVDDDNFLVARIAYFPLFNKSLNSFPPPKDAYFQLKENEYFFQNNKKDNEFYFVVGSCNGLLCLLGHSTDHEYDHEYEYVEKLWFQIWNPATKTVSPRLCFCSSWDDEDSIIQPFSFTFGCDESTNTYKVVEMMKTKVRVFNLRSNTWRYIQYYPMYLNQDSAVYLRGSINWLATQNRSGPYYVRNDITINQFVIISLDLRTETHTQLLPPQGFDKDFDEMPYIEPKLTVLKDCLSFCYDFKQIHYVIWQMKEFEVEDSWIQFLKISYRNLRIPPNGLYHLLPVCVAEKNGTLLLTSRTNGKAILYNLRDDRVEKLISLWWWRSATYVESLVSYF
ncbi:F-box/kelch-repeat protein At3g23880-like [Vicia villosa]|uniref:F-box/kelch-repeat protein At3g23880-like n=1 Tax=Vicia villosa TaxID=3911 RepID=UPI00273CD168|nr:F-box/kelch-repeat protein At3g23880-like [Vicia villosa]